MGNQESDFGKPLKSLWNSGNQEQIGYFHPLPPPRLVLPIPDYLAPIPQLHSLPAISPLPWFSPGPDLLNDKFSSLE